VGRGERPVDHPRPLHNTKRPVGGECPYGQDDLKRPNTRASEMGRKGGAEHDQSVPVRPGGRRLMALNVRPQGGVQNPENAGRAANNGPKGCSANRPRDLI